ncbi:MAG: NAD(P)-dependent glycerol-3-phosphate dehydrogenase [Betaproteobacteria bacterium]|nr:NAD(P)-dependent glycerol-3-phosphate dehydrogenase [Betaproteobacteria bacterium]
MTAPIAILGAGAWGTALAVKLAPRFAIALWARDTLQAEALRATRRNARYLPDFVLPHAIHVTAELSDAVRGARCVIVATPAAGLRETIAALPDQGVPLLWLCKGFVFEGAAARLPHQSVATRWRGGWGLLSGPSFAQEVAANAPTALTLAGRDMAFAEEWAAALRDESLRLYASDDVAGVEVGGAVKNVLAIATGICDGLHLGDNARAALITRGLAEMSRLAAALGGRRETLMGLSGLGDLVLTCTGALSRNRQAGLLLAAGKSLPEIQLELGHVAEGMFAARAVRQLAARENIEMPISEAVCRVLYDDLSPRQAVVSLLQREPARE